MNLFRSDAAVRIAVFEHICCLGRHWIPIVVSETNGGVGTTGLRHDQCLAIPQRPPHFHEARAPKTATSTFLSFFRRFWPRWVSGRPVHLTSVNLKRVGRETGGSG